MERDAVEVVGEPGDPSSLQVEFHLVSAINGPRLIVLATKLGGKLPRVAMDGNDSPGIHPTYGVEKAGEVGVI